MKYYTQELHKSVQFYSYYFVSDIYLDMFILKKMYPYGEEFDFESAKQTIEECYESNVYNNFNEKILYFSELRKYLINENLEKVKKILELILNSDIVESVNIDINYILCDKEQVSIL